MQSAQSDPSILTIEWPEIQHAEDWVMRCREKNPSLQTRTGGPDQELKERALCGKAWKGVRIKSKEVD